MLEHDQPLQEPDHLLAANHAPFAIPRVTIDAKQAQFNFATADRTTILAALAFGTSATTASATFTTAVSYAGRGVLTMAMLGEFNAGIMANNGGLRLTIDGNVVYSSGAHITRQSSLRVLVGSLVVPNSAPTALAIVADDDGVPFNSSCLIEFSSNGTRLVTAAWKIAKKS